MKFIRLLGRPRRSPRTPARDRGRGQGLVEFALVLPLLLLILLFAVDFGRLYFGWINLQNAARVGANYAALHPDAWGTPGDATAQAAYVAQIQNDATTINCALPLPLPAPTFPDGSVLGGRAQVTLTCRFAVITPVISAIVGSPVSLGASAVFPIRAGLVTVP